MNEAVRVGQVGGVENGLTLFTDGRSLAEVDHGGRQHADAGMAMVVVIPGEESLAEGVAVLKAAEAIGELGAILHGAKLTF